MKTTDLIKEALAEDLPQGDITTDSLGIENHSGRGYLIAKEDLILSASGIFQDVMLTVDPTASIKWHFKDSELILKGQTVASLKGNLVQILKGERVALNFLGRLSGIATLTRCFVKTLGDSKTKILDTRKTTPLLRQLEKQAVVDGGGMNHRLNLSDSVLIKDNHIRLAGSITQAIEKTRRHTDVSITVECSTLEDVEEAVSLNVHRILLDNMNDDRLRAALQIIPANIETEASGNMNLERVKQLAGFGLKYISIGALTHSAPCADFSLLFDWENL